MKNENTLLNLLTFSKPTQSLTFYFANKIIDKSVKLHFSNYPAGIEALFPGITSDKEQELYTTFDFYTAEGKPLPIQFVPENYGLFKRFYNNKINFYFRKLKGKIVKVDYVKDNQVWLQLPSPTVNDHLLYDRFTIKVQFSQVSEFPELVISYDGQSKIMKQALPAFVQDVDPATIGWVRHKQSVFKYHKLENGFSDVGNCYPVLNNDIRNLLGIPPDQLPRGNRYLRYHKKITDFITEWLDTAQFKELIPLTSVELHRISPSRVSITRPESNLLLFGKKTTGQVPIRGLSNYGPYATPPHSSIHLFYIMHEDDKKYSIPFNSALLNNDGKSSFVGLQKFAGVMTYLEKGFSIVFKDRENPLPEVKKALAAKNLNPDNRYIAIYLSPWPKTEASPARHKIYFLMKELLLKYRITMQGIDVQKIRFLNDNFKYSLINIAIAMLAKLDGTPWRLNATLKNELVIGIGAFKQVSTGVQYLGSAFSFDNQGKLNQFDYFLKNDTRLLAGSIKTAVREFATRKQGAQRLIIHFYKTMSEHELRPIEEVLNNLGLDIPVFVVAINKTESEQLTAFDSGSDQLMPVSGTYINIGRSQFLLFNNTLYPGMPHKPSDGYPFPVKLSLQCNHPELLSDASITGNLIDQVYQFSRLYYKSVRQQPLPITIKYPEMLASIAPNFHDQVIPPFGKDNLWFL